MRITGGLSKGHSLKTPMSRNIRPTSDKVREAVFSIIGQDLFGVVLLDLFAGTGSLGLEGLSRGAARAVFVDYSEQSIKLIRDNLRSLGFQDCGMVLKRDLRRGIPQDRPIKEEQFQLVFIDPPYGRDFIPPLLSEFSETDLLTRGSRVIAESFKDEELPDSFRNLEKTDVRLYGDTKISVYTCKD
ncbi:MAG: 16S rRNA (guanine(966)-N(2))-methyltransferase RsmD [Desulfatiglans sp.]|jgi:16S rRNA (guanine966-N2)-methyltransferase|nr:16S rRNA (guanine(966)-N(2))-methyltransferase RsmD [Desulfatiglans sp.]